MSSDGPKVRNEVAREFKSRVGTDNVREKMRTSLLQAQKQARRDAAKMARQLSDTNKESESKGDESAAAASGADSKSAGAAGAEKPASDKRAWRQNREFYARQLMLPQW